MSPGQIASLLLCAAAGGALGAALGLWLGLRGLRAEFQRRRRLALDDLAAHGLEITRTEKREVRRRVGPAE